MKQRKFNHSYLYASLLGMAFILGLPEAQADCAQQRDIRKDIPQSTDHPLINRVKGSSICQYQFKTDGELRLPTAGVNNDTLKIPNTRLQGKVTRITYALPERKKIAAILDNYKEALERARFDIAFLGSTDELGARFSSVVYKNLSCLSPRGKKSPTGLKAAPSGYFVARRSLGRNGNIWVSAFATVGSGPQAKRCSAPAYLHIDLVEESPSSQELAQVNDRALADELDKNGKVAIYGIQFDLDSSKLKPESLPVLVEITKLLQKRKDLTLQIVGHTDWRGSLSYNQQLSQDRANTIRNYLIESQGISPKQLNAYGVGSLSPVSSNDSEKGRQLNERIELIKAR